MRRCPGRSRRRVRRGDRSALVVGLALLLAACGPAPAVPTPGPSPAPSRPGPNLLEACDPARLVPCIQPDAVLSVPIAGTGLSLTYSSLWAPGRQGHPDWDPASLGIGGFSVSVVDAYAPGAGVLLGGDGSWRRASLVPAGPGETAVPSFDASTADVFDAAGRHVRTVDGRLGTTRLTITYDTAGRLARVAGTVRGQPASLTVRRTDNGTPTALLGIDGAVIGITLDGRGRLAALRDPAGHLTTFDWLPGGLLAAETDPMGSTTRFTYDGTGHLATSTDPDGVATRYGRTATDAGVTVTATTALGRTSTHRTTRADGGITRTYVGPDGTTTSETEDASGRRTIRYPDGTTLVIDARPSGLWGADAPVPASLTETRSDGVTTRAQVVEALQPVDGRPYAATGTVTTTIDGGSWVESLDPASRTDTVVDPAGRRSVRTYDAAGRLLTSVAPGRPALAFTYDPSGRVSTMTVGTGAAARTTRYAYDATTGRITATRPDGSVTSERVDALGNPVAFTAADGTTTLASYDTARHPVEIQPPGALSFVVGTSAAGRATGFLPPSTGGPGYAETTTYDADGRPTAVTGPGTRPVEIAYDAAGRIAGWATAQGLGSLTYAAAGLLESAVDGSGVQTTYGYAGSALAGLRWSGPLAGSVATTIDGLGRTTGVAVDGGTPLALTYDDAGSLTGVGPLTLIRDPVTGLVTRQTLGRVETDFAYDEAAALLRATTRVGSRIVLDRRYARDALGRIAGVTEVGADAATTTAAYAYDAADRLASVEVGGATVESDTYDPAGDRIAVRTGSGTTRATYDDRQRLTRWASATYTWRADGTLTSVRSSAGTTSFAFDDLARLTGVTLADGETVTYLLDAAGRRVGREVSGRLVAGYLYDPAGRVVALTDGSGAVVERFGYDDQGHLVLVVRGRATYAVVTDQLGSPRLVIDASSGAVVDAIGYDTWGRVTSESAPGLIPFGFAGGLRDPDTGLVHFGARDYDPGTGRWISADPIRFAASDPNLYRYASGDPVDRSDPSGLDDQPHLIVLSTTIPRQPPDGPATPPPPPPTPPAPPTPLPVPVLHCWALHCTPNSPDPNALPGEGYCHFAACDFPPGGDFWCLGLSCTGPSGTSCSVGLCWYGDTHVLTGDGVHYDFQAAGEFVAARSPDGSLQVQVRQEPVLGGTTVTFATAVALGVAGDRVGIYAREPSFLVVDGTAVASDLVERLPHGGTVERHGGTVTIGWPDGSRLTVFRVADTLNLAFGPSASAASTLRGLFGSADGDPSNDLTGRDGTILTRGDPAFATKLYRQLGDSWRIRPAESLFDYGPGESTATFTRLDIPTATVTAAGLAADRRGPAETVCRAVGVRWEPLLDDCILDLAETGEPVFAAAEAAVAAAGPAAAPVASGAPAPSPAPSAAAPSAAPFAIALGQPVSGAIGAPGEHADYTFTATAGDVIYGHSGQVGCDRGLRWRLLDPAGHLIGMGPGICQEIGRVVLPTAGIYTVRIDAADGMATGPYQFVVSAVPPTKVDHVSIGQSVSGALDSPGEWHDYAFSVTAGQRLFVRSGGPCSPGLSWDLIGADGSLVDFHSACGTMGPEVIAVSATETLRVLGSGPATGPYSFRIEQAP